LEGWTRPRKQENPRFLLEEKQARKKTNVQPPTPVPPTPVSARIQARAASAAANETSDESHLSNEEGLDAGKEARESALLKKNRGK